MEARRQPVHTLPLGVDTMKCQYRRPGWGIKSGVRERRVRLAEVYGKEPVLELVCNSLHGNNGKILLHSQGGASKCGGAVGRTGEKQTEEGFRPPLVIRLSSVLYFINTTFRMPVKLRPSTPVALRRMKYTPLPSIWPPLPVPFHSTE